MLISQLYHCVLSILLVKDLDTFYSCPRLVSGASMSGFILTSIGYKNSFNLLISLTFPHRPLFEGDNDFRRCLKELFPALQVHFIIRQILTL